MPKLQHLYMSFKGGLLAKSQADVQHILQAKYLVHMKLLILCVLQNNPVPQENLC